MEYPESAFLQNVHHAYAQTDGTFAWPSSREGDMIKQAKCEIDLLRAQVEKARIKAEAQAVVDEVEGE